MISYNFLPYLMSDPFSLSLYQGLRNENLAVKISNEKFDILKNLEKNWMQCAHLADSFIPNHIRRNWNLELKQVDTMPSSMTLKNVILQLLPKVADELFDLQGNLIVVKENQLDYWQFFSKSFSPLVIKVAFLWKHRNDIQNIKQAVSENFNFTAIPSYALATQWKENVADLHVHFNNAIEVDDRWVRILQDPQAWIQYNRTTHSFADFRNHSIIKDCDSVKSFLDAANCFLSEIWGGMKKKERQETFDSELASHAWVIYHVFQLLERKDCKLVEFYKFHHYLLIAGAFRELFVMQDNQMGLEQFNEVLHDPFKGVWNDCDYAKQVLRQQMGGNLGLQVGCVEFRLSAKQLSGLDEYRRGIGSLGGPPPVHFICSLIKSDVKESKIDNALSELRKYTDDVVAVDVAGKDFDASPSAFKDVFDEIRKMPRKMPWRFTYHVGEDFYHILGGLRMIYEAATLLGLNPKDRLGHASAAGVDPRIWSERLHGVVPIKVGDYIADLNFAIELIKKSEIEALLPKIPEVEKYINEILGREKEDRIIKVSCFEFFDENEIKLLQLEILHKISQEGLIIEACPTSNVSIGYDHSLKSYHLRKWLKWKYVQNLDLPDFVIGSDEIGVFPTNISNEYAYVYEMMMKDEVLKGKAEEILKDLARNSMKYAF